MLKKINNRLLAVDPGTREIGIALMEDKDLIYYGVKSFQKRKPLSALLEQVNHVFKQLIEEYSPAVLVIEKTFFYSNKNVSNLIAVAEEIKALAKKYRLQIAEYAPKTVRKNVCKSGKATKVETANILCSRFPELHIYRQQNRKWKEKYWLNMFDAVALGVTYFDFSQNTG